MAVRDLMLPLFLRRVARDTRSNWVYDWPSAWSEPVILESAARAES